MAPFLLNKKLYKHMKKTFILITLVVLGTISYAQEFMQMTTIESVVPGGLGRSRMVIDNGDGKVEEVKMENFFSLVGINFSNVRANDKMITDKITEFAKEGWALQHVTPGVYSSNEGGTGIFITRYLFKKD